MGNNNLSGNVFSLQICPGHRKQMKQVQSAEAIERVGLKGDLHAIRESSRQILLIEIETLNELALNIGDVKENITTEGLQLMKLPFGQKLKIGSEVVLDITKPCSPCSRMEEVRAGLLGEIAGRRGMLARVVSGGIIARGDTVVILQK